jgi:hypothetical protein
MPTFFKSFWAVALFFVLAIVYNVVFHVPGIGFQRGYAFIPMLILLAFAGYRQFFTKPKP